MTSGFAASDGFGAGAIGQRRLDRNGRGRGAAWRRVPQVVAVCLAMAGAASNAFGIDGSPSQRRPPPHKWTTFVQVDGQPEPVPAEWVATPEGRFAHSLKIPNPVPKDSGYRWWMSSKDYFKHLCDTEAGEFIYEKVENVEGFLFMRPPGRASDSDLMDKYKLEAPGFEAPYSIRKDTIAERGSRFVSPTTGLYQYIEEPSPKTDSGGQAYLRASGDSVHDGIELKTIESEADANSAYALTWRGIVRRNDRARRIAGFEVLVVRRETKQILGVWRGFVASGGSSVGPHQVAWLNAAYCPAVQEKYAFPERRALLGFVTRVLAPKRSAVAEQR